MSEARDRLIEAIAAKRHGVWDRADKDTRDWYRTTTKRDVNGLLAAPDDLLAVLVEAGVLGYHNGYYRRIKGEALGE